MCVAAKATRESKILVYKRTQIGKIRRNHLIFSVLICVICMHPVPGYVLLRAYVSVGELYVCGALKCINVKLFPSAFICMCILLYFKTNLTLGYTTSETIG